MEFTDKGFIKIEVKDLIDWQGGNGDGCLVSNRITKDGWKVGYMYREAPDEGRPDSGWRFMKGDESNEYSSSPSNLNVFKINTICNYDPDIIPYLKAPVGSGFIRVSDHKFEEDHQDKKIYYAKQERCKE